MTAHWADQSGWKAKLVGGPYDSPRPQTLMATQPLDEAPPQVNVYRCECCDATVIVAPGLHPREDILGPVTVYRLDRTFVGAERALLLAVYVHESIPTVLDGLSEDIVVGVGA